jgi:hypothetical protein
MYWVVDVFVRSQTGVNSHPHSRLVLHRQGESMPMLQRELLLPLELLKGGSVCADVVFLLW